MTQLYRVDVTPTFFRPVGQLSLTHAVQRVAAAAAFLVARDYDVVFASYPGSFITLHARSLSLAPAVVTLSPDRAHPETGASRQTPVTKPTASGDSGSRTPPEAIVAVGDAFDGLRLFGPFADASEATEYASTTFAGEPWTVAPLNTPGAHP